MSKSREGYIYILSNEAMPGLVKIGRSSKGSLQKAADRFDAVLIESRSKK